MREYSTENILTSLTDIIWMNSIHFSLRVHMWVLALIEPVNPHAMYVPFELIV